MELEGSYEIIKKISSCSVFMFNISLGVEHIQDLTRVGSGNVTWRRTWGWYDFQPSQGKKKPLTVYQKANYEDWRYNSNHTRNELNGF